MARNMSNTERRLKEIYERRAMSCQPQIHWVKGKRVMRGEYYKHQKENHTHRFSENVRNYANNNCHIICQIVK